MRRRGGRDSAFGRKPMTPATGYGAAGSAARVVVPTGSWYG
jgi:hypothetical protein